MRLSRFDTPFSLATVMLSGGFQGVHSDEDGSARGDAAMCLADRRQRAVIDAYHTLTSCSNRLRYWGSSPVEAPGAVQGARSRVAAGAVF